MSLYSAGQLIGKTMLLNKTVNVYSVIDLNNDGDNAKPIGTLKNGSTFVVDSILYATSGYISSYGIRYAARKVPYFTYYDGTTYKAIAIIADGRFSVSALRDQGAITVKEEVAAAKKAEENATNPLKGLFDGLGLDFDKIKGFLIAIVLIILAIYLLPMILRAVNEAKAK